MTTFQFDVHPEAYEKFVSCGWRNVGMLAACLLPAAAGILVVEYRLMLFSIILVAIPLIALIEAWRVDRAVKDFRPSSVVWNEASITLRGMGETRILAFRERTEPPQPALAFVRVWPDAILLFGAPPSMKWRPVVVPASGKIAGELVDHARSRGVPVHVEKRISLALAAPLAGALLYVGAGKVAAVLALGGLANVILYGAGKSGSLAPAGALFAGALVLIGVKALLRAPFDPPQAS